MEERDIQVRKLMEELSLKTSGSVNAKEFGFFGDGQKHPLSQTFSTLAQAQTVYPHATALTDETDWCAIQSAINYAASVGGCDVTIPNGDSYVNATILVKPNVKLILNKGAVIHPTTDIHIIRLNLNARITGGTIDVSSVPNFSKSCICLEGEDKFGTVRHNTSISSIILRNYTNNIGKQSGTGIYMHAKGDGHCICWVNVQDVTFSYFDKGIYLQCEYSDSGVVSYINGNQFDNIRFSQNSFDIYLDGNDGVPYETSGNQFTNIQSQPSFNTKFFYLSGNSNVLKGYFWDSHVITSGEKAILTKKATYTEIESNLLPYQIADNAQWYNKINTILGSTVNITTPLAPGEFMFAGNQDDYLAFAYKRGIVVTQSSGAALVSGALNNIFDIDGYSSARWDGKASITNPIVLEISFPSTLLILSNLGLTFGPSRESPKNLKIEKYYSGSWSTLINLSGMGAQNNFILRKTISPVDKIRVTLSGTNDATNNCIRIYRMYGQSSIGMAYLSSNGGDLYGDVTYSKGVGARLTAPNGTTYKQSVDNQGKLSIGSSVLNLGLSGVSSSRPDTNIYIGMPYFDTTLGKPIWCKSIGVQQVEGFQIINGASSSGTISISLGGTKTDISVTAGDTISTIVDKLKATTFPGWSVTGAAANTPFICEAVGPKTVRSFSDGGTGVITSAQYTSTVGVAATWVDAAGSIV